MSKLNPEQLARKREYQRKWRQEHKGEMRAAWESWHAAHPEYKAPGSKGGPPRVYTEEQRARRRAVDARREAIKNAVEVCVSADEAIARFRSGKRWRCYICGESVSGSDCQIDHIVPLAKGGRHAADNLAPVHALCNQRKRAHLIHDFVPPEGQLVLC